MNLGEALISVWRQMLDEKNSVVELEGERYRVRTTSGKRLRAVDFTCGSYQVTGIEQNPETTSRWAALAREGKRIMQFKCEGRYVANVCEGKLLRYPAWKALELPE